MCNSENLAHMRGEILGLTEDHERVSFDSSEAAQSSKCVYLLKFSVDPEAQRIGDKFHIELLRSEDRNGWKLLELKVQPYFERGMVSAMIEDPRGTTKPITAGGHAEHMIEQHWKSEAFALLNEFDAYSCFCSIGARERYRRFHSKAG